MAEKRHGSQAIGIQLLGMDVVIRNLEHKVGAVKEACRGAINASAFIVDQKAKARITSQSTDTGDLKRRNHVVLATDEAGDLLAGGVSNPMQYAGFVEFGTGRYGAQTFRTNPDSAPSLPKGYRHGTKHNVGAKHVEGWARRHGANPYAVAAAIRRRGGLKARPFLWPAFRDESKVFPDKVKARVQAALKAK